MAAVSDATRNPVPERRYLTTLFADLVGYTALSERLDPELLRDLQLQYQELTRDIMERYGGFVAAYSGDGVLVYFGYPTAHENDAERGVRAALELIDECRQARCFCRSRSVGGAFCPHRSHTGLVVVGPEIASLGRSVQGVVGELVNIAARLQAEAEPNTVVVSGATRELIDGLFDFQPLGPRPIRGLSRADFGSSRARAASWRRPGGRALAAGCSQADRPPGVAGPAGGAVAGRRSGIPLPRRACRGEAGLGKSRLVLELCETLALPDSQILQANCLEMFSSTPLYPAAGPLWTRAGIRADDSEAARRDKIAAFLSARGIESPEAIETLAGLLGVALTGTPAAAHCRPPRSNAVSLR